MGRGCSERRRLQTALKTAIEFGRDVTSPIAVLEWRNYIINVYYINGFDCTLNITYYNNIIQLVA